MAKRPRKPRLDLYEAMRDASGWYLAAWRDFRGLTLEDLADEAGTSKGMVSDLETGARNSKGQIAQRFNRDWLDKFSAALGVRRGHLIDVNPYAVDEQETAWAELFRNFTPEQRALAINLARQISLARRE